MIVEAEMQKIWELICFIFCRHDFKVDGRPFIEYLKNEAYRDEIKEFKDILAAIGKKQGWELADLKRMFSNDMLDQLFFGDVV